jgi:AcrR family transcriptional regulator
VNAASSTETRHTAEERRDEVLDAAMIEFAEAGLHGASTEAIAKRAGISQPYVFRLFGTKKDLFKATTARCLRETLELFQRAAEGKRGEAALQAIGDAYRDLLANDPTRLRAQMQAYAACDDPEVCEIVQAGYGDLVAYVERVSGLPTERVSAFFAKGMLLNVIASMGLVQSDEGWAKRLIEGCRQEA